MLQNDLNGLLFMDNTNHAYPLSRRDWNQARRKAIIEQLMALLDKHPHQLLPFEAVSKALQLRKRVYEGLQDIALDSIVGSVGRYDDFTRAFFPRHAQVEDRWRRVDTLVHLGGVPPVELYRVSEVYFVRDGNHRVSVARQQAAPSIEAYVWSFTSDVVIHPDDEIDDIILAIEKQHFFEQTQLDKTRPQSEITLTEAGKYPILLRHILVYQNLSTQADEGTNSFAETALQWHDSIYQPFVETLTRLKALVYFPDRTPADMFVWFHRHRSALSEIESAERIQTVEIEQFVDEHYPSMMTRLKHWFQSKVRDIL
ncbi:MAG: hypothetical protein Q9P44_19335 [Anaerolineae bacterium]|nr:hypothetical protein [Anaerolineae bacterium]